MAYQDRYSKTGPTAGSVMPTGMNMTPQEAMAAARTGFQGRANTEKQPIVNIRFEVDSDENLAELQKIKEHEPIFYDRRYNEIMSLETFQRRLKEEGRANMAKFRAYQAKHSPYMDGVRMDNYYYRPKPTIPNDVLDKDTAAFSMMEDTQFMNDRHWVNAKSFVCPRQVIDCVWHMGICKAKQPKALATCIYGVCIASNKTGTGMNIAPNALLAVTFSQDRETGEMFLRHWSSKGKNCAPDEDDCGGATGAYIIYGRVLQPSGQQTAFGPLTNPDLHTLKAAKIEICMLQHAT